MLRIVYFCFFLSIDSFVVDSDGNYWINSNNTLYALSVNILPLANISFGSIINISMSSLSQCLECDALNNTLSVCVLVGNSINITNTIALNNAGAALT